jgi:hypothetical protein
VQISVGAPHTKVTTISRPVGQWCKLHHEHFELQQQDSGRFTCYPSSTYISTNAAPTSLEGNFCIITDHKAPLIALSHLCKTEQRNPCWRLNRNWEILHSINHNQDNHKLESQLGTDNDLLLQIARHTAGIRILEYKTTYPHPVIKQQPTIAYGMAYLCHRGTIINKQYDEEITYYYNWPKFTRHCCEKFLWSTHTFNLVNWKAFQHWGKRLNINCHTHLLNLVYEWLPIR